MKRKLDANYVPTPAEDVTGNLEESSFAGLGLDPRLLQAIAKQNFATPTLVQCKAIPLALDGRDVLARAKTGSGKTAAYLLPILHSILKRKQVCSADPSKACKLISTVFAGEKHFSTYTCADSRTG
jgi:ATP-dependent RNA helicase DDX56/DBP9